MNFYQWHQSHVWGMQICRKQIASGAFPAWSDLEEFHDNEACLKGKISAVKEYAELLGLRATVTLQLDSDTRQVRLLKDGQPEDEIEQCYKCIFGAIHRVEAPDYDDIYCSIGHDMATCKDCPDWRVEDWRPEEDDVF